MVAKGGGWLLREVENHLLDVFLLCCEFAGTRLLLLLHVLGALLRCQVLQVLACGGVMWCGVSGVV